MHSWLSRMLLGALASGVIAGAPAAVALANPQHPHTKAAHMSKVGERTTSETPGEGSEGSEGTESDGGAKQAAACQAAGVDANGSNVQYDEQTGSCTANGGGENQTRQ